MDLLHPSGRTLPQTTEEAEVFQAHAYRLAIKCYQPQLPFNILLKEPKLEQFSRLSYDPDLIYLSHPCTFLSFTTHRYARRDDLS